jgi:hypothetical protein
MAYGTTPGAPRVRWAALAALDGAERLTQTLVLREFTLAMQREGTRSRERVTSQRGVNNTGLEADHRDER